MPSYNVLNPAGGVAYRVIDPNTPTPGYDRNVAFGITPPPARRPVQRQQQTAPPVTMPRGTVDEFFPQDMTRALLPQNPPDFSGNLRNTMRRQAASTPTQETPAYQGLAALDPTVAQHANFSNPLYEDYARDVYANMPETTMQDIYPYMTPFANPSNPAYTDYLRGELGIPNLRDTLEAALSRDTSLMGPTWLSGFRAF